MQFALREPGSPCTWVSLIVAAVGGHQGKRLGAMLAEVSPACRGSARAPFSPRKTSTRTRDTHQPCSPPRADAGRPGRPAGKAGGALARPPLPTQGRALPAEPSTQYPPPSAPYRVGKGTLLVQPAAAPPSSRSRGLALGFSRARPAPSRPEVAVGAVVRELRCRRCRAVRGPFPPSPPASRHAPAAPRGLRRPGLPRGRPGGAGPRRQALRQRLRAGPLGNQPARHSRQPQPALGGEDTAVWGGDPPGGRQPQRGAQPWGGRPRRR